MTGDISGAATVLGLIGDPVAQARSPLMINPLLASGAYGGEAVLVPMHVARGELEAPLAGIRRWQNFAGAIVTMPHKSDVVRFLDQASEEVEQVGACNVIRRDADGRLAGTMLDGEGFVAGLRAEGHEISGKSVLLIGAGGAAAGIAFALARHGARALTIMNRTAARAEALAERVGASSAGAIEVMASTRPVGADLVVNATSLGMREEDPLPVDPAALDPATLVADIIVAPEITALLRHAADRGCPIHTGMAMLPAQIDLMLRFMLDAAEA